MRRAPGAAIAVVGSVVLAASGWVLLSLAGQRHAARLREAKAALKAGVPAKARAILEGESGRWAWGGETEYLLGVTEKLMGRLDAARASWRRVPSGSAFAGSAALMLAREELAGHRLAEAERYLPAALAAPGAFGVEARETLLHLYKLQGRIEEARRLVREGWDRYPDRVGTLQELWRLDTPTPLSLESHRLVLENAARSAPDDDRIWLGRAFLETRVGRYEEAARLLEACRARRPLDPAVWRVWLDWALATQDVALARRSLEYLSPELVAPTEVLALRAWFAARAGDAAEERRALARLVASAPGSLASLDRLAGLALQAGEPEESARLRQRKAELDQILESYSTRLFQPDPAAGAKQLALWAELLGRHFDARGWWTLANRRDPTLSTARAEGLLRIARAESVRAQAETLAELRTRLGPPPPAAPAPAAPPLGPMPSFVDDARAVGLRFVYHSGASPERQIPETMGTGIGLLDYDGDGWLDVYCTQGGPFPPPPGRLPNHDRLFRNRGDGTFEDASESSGIASLLGGYGHGVAVGDYDNDGHPDLFLTRWGSYALYHNKGNGTFDDATESAGLGGERDWPTSAAFADLDGDGDLDLYVCHYLVWDALVPMICNESKFHANRLCNPGKFPSRPDRLYRNDAGRFIEVTRDAGIIDKHGRGLGVVAADFDGDGRVDLYVANDQTANFLWRNLGALRFEELGHTAGVAASGAGGYQAGMGVATGDLDGDGLPELVVTNFYDEGTTLYQNLGQGIFSDRSEAFGLSVATRARLGFGIAFLDANNDGRLDLVQANGHVDDFRPEAPYAMLAQLFLGDARGRLTDVSARAGPAFRLFRLGRALAVGDLDNDGRADVLLACLDEPLIYLHNSTAGGHWLTLRLEGTASNRDAAGARVEATAGGRTQVVWRSGGGSYQASGDPRLHFGLGSAERIETLAIRWPSGRVDRHADLPANAAYLICEGESTPRHLPGFEPIRSPAR
jgi:hypothetical protein